VIAVPRQDVKREIKTRYDPTTLFHRNQDIPPAD
jgi:hypothetical protein